MKHVDCPIRVMIVEDTDTQRLLLEEIVERDSRLTVACSVASGEEALRRLRRVSPDVISLDIRLPGIDGFEVTRAVMAERPTPIVVVAANVESDELRISMNALKAGALSIVEKPVGVGQASFEPIATRLCRQLVLMSDVKPVRQRDGSTERPALRERARRSAPTAANVYGADGGADLLGIVASTGGPNALITILQSIGANFPLPIVLVQHITASFLEGFASWLSAAGGIETRIVQHSTMLTPGVIHIAPADRHLVVSGSRVYSTDAPEVAGQRPSGTVLLRSMAETVGSRGIGVLLTGMGADGAEGLLALRKSGGLTIAEDASTTVVYGMPKVAAEMDAVDEQLPLHRIGPRLAEIARIYGMAS